MNRKKAHITVVCSVITLLVLCNSCQHYNDKKDFTVTVLPDKTATITGYVGSSKDVRIPPQIGKLPVTIIGKDAFKEKELTSVTIPDSVTHIGDRAFANNRLTEIIIPNNVTSIEREVFQNNNLTSLTIPKGVVSIGRGAFEYNMLTEITIPKSVTSIGSNAFAHNDITKIIIGHNVNLESDALPDFNYFYEYILKKRGGTYTYGDYHWSPEDNVLHNFWFFNDWNGKFSNIAFFADMPNLYDVSLSNNDLLTDITPLSGLTKLRILTIHDCPNIESLEALSSLTNLESLSITHNDGYDYKVLIPLRQLEYLGIIGNNTDDIDLSHIGQLHFLKRLRISNSINQNVKFLNINELQNLVNLEYLYISGIHNLDISWVSSLRYLATVRLEKCTINDIRPLATLPNLVEVQLGSSRIRDVAPLLNSNSIKYIKVWFDDVEVGVSNDLRSRFAQKNIRLDDFSGGH